MTKLQIGDIVKPKNQDLNQELIAIKTEKHGTTFLAGGLWWKEEDLTLIQPFGTDWKVGARVCIREGEANRQFTIAKIDRRVSDGSYWLWSKEVPVIGYPSTQCILVATDEVPPSVIKQEEANDDWTGKIVRCISDKNFYKDISWFPKIESLYVVRSSSAAFLELKEDPTPGAIWSRNRFELVGDIPQSLTLKVDPTLYEETIQKRDEDVRSLSEENKKLTTRLEELRKDMRTFQDQTGIDFYQEQQTYCVGHRVHPSIPKHIQQLRDGIKQIRDILGIDEGADLLAVLRNLVEDGNLNRNLLNRYREQTEISDLKDSAFFIKSSRVSKKVFDAYALKSHRIEELEKQNQDTQILVNRIKKLKELVTPVAEMLDI